MKRWLQRLTHSGSGAVFIGLVALGVAWPLWQLVDSRVTLGSSCERDDARCVARRSRASVQPGRSSPPVEITAPPAATRAATSGDIDGDGRSDLLFVDPATGSLRIHFVNGTQLSPALVGPASSGHRVSTADFNGDRRADLLLDDGLQLRIMLGLGDGSFLPADLVSSMPSTAMVASTADVDGDGRSDITIRDHARHALTHLIMIGTQVIESRSGPVLRASERFEAIGGVFAAGARDMLTSDGRHVYARRWMSDGTYSSPQAVPLPTTDWDGGYVTHVVAFGAGADYEASAYLDGLLNGLPIRLTSFEGHTAYVRELQPAPPAGLSPGSFIAHGDFNGDGRSDLLWSNGTNYAIALRRASFDGGSGFHDAQPVLALDSAWQLVGGMRQPPIPGDFDGDARSDIFVLDSTTGDVRAMRMANGRAVGFTDIGRVPPQSRALGGGDFNDDGLADVVIVAGNETRLLISQRAGRWSLTPAVAPLPAEWRVAGIGQGDGDWRADLLLIQPHTREFRYASLDGGVVVSLTPPQLLPGSYELVALGHFDRDRLSDLVVSGPSDFHGLMPAKSPGTVLEFRDQDYGVTLGTDRIPVAAARMNRDALDDLVITSRDGNHAGYVQTYQGASVQTVGNWAAHPSAGQLQTQLKLNELGWSDLLWRNGMQVLVTRNVPEGHVRGFSAPAHLFDLVPSETVVDMASSRLEAD